MDAYSAAVAYARQSGGSQSCRGRAIIRAKSNVACRLQADGLVRKSGVELHPTAKAQQT
jgi:hypothetical protein